MSITPQQLPDRASNFIAYGAEQRAPDPTSNNDPITIRPQVYVRYYPGIVVSQLQVGGRSGDREGLVTVHLDPSSIGFKDPISAHMNADDQTLPILQNALDNQVPVAIAIETQRKKKNTADGTPISPLTPIHALRGAQHPNGDGEGQMMIGPSRNNTSNRVAFVNGQGTQHLQSSPAEWKSLVNNKVGDLPPEGWRNFAPGEDWKDVGAAIRSGAPAPTSTGGGGVPTPQQLDGVVQNAVAQALQNFAPALVEQITQAGAATQGRTAGKFYEGKPWEPRTSDGRINLGGYVVAGERWVFEWAHRHLTETLGLEDVSIEDTWTLSEMTLALAGEVQAVAYGHGFVTDRTLASHRESEHWVQWTISNVHHYPGNDADETVLTEWKDTVVKEASALHSKAGQRAGEYFATVTKRDQNGAAQQTKTSTKSASSGPSEKVVRAFLDVVEKGWNSADSIQTLGRQGRDNGYAGLRVSMVSDEDGAHISYPPVDGQPSGPLESLLLDRYENLQAQAPQNTQETQEPGPEEAPAPTEATHEAPAEETPAEQAPTAEADTIPAEQSEQTNPQDSPDSSAGPADTIVESLKTVTDERTLRSIYENARDSNLLSVKVHVTPGPSGEVIFGEPGAEGFQEQTVASVIKIILNSMSKPPQTESEDTASSDQPQTQEAQNPAPEQANEDETSADPQPEPEAAQAEHTDAPDDTPEADAAPEEQAVPDEQTAASNEAEADAEATPEESAVAEPQNDANSGEGSEAQKIADAARASSTPDEIAALREEAEQNGLLEENIQDGGREGKLGRFLTMQSRRAVRAPRNQK